MERYYPQRWAEPWDNVGLTVGRLDAEVAGILICLDVTAATVNEAVDRGCGLIVSHHPFPWQEKRRFDTSSPETSLLVDVFAGKLNLFAAHTNLDAAPSGHAAWLAGEIGLTGIKPLRPTDCRLAKVAVYTPSAKAAMVREAMSAAGAGRIGQYAGCSFSIDGTGRYLPLPGSHPAPTEMEIESTMPEQRVEMICPLALSDQVAAAARRVHPYETMAYEIWPLSSPEPDVGLGRIGRLPEAITARDLLAALRCRLDESALITTVGELDRRVECAAVCPGAAGDLVDAAAIAGAQVLIGGEFSHHDALAAAGRGMTLINVDHYSCELPAKAILLRTCAAIASEQGMATIAAEAEENPFRA